MEGLGLLLLLPVAFIAAGVLFAVLGVRSRRGAKAFRARGARASALVTEVRNRWDRHTGGDSSLRRYPVVRFTLPDGREVETETPGANPAPAKEGAQVTVLYDPASPTDAVIDTRWGDGSTAGGLMVAFGVLFATVGAAFLAIALFFLSLD